MNLQARLAVLVPLLLAAATPPAQAQDANQGRNQARGDSKALAGVSAEKIIAAINDFKSGAQPATIMHQIAKGYTDDQVKAIAAFFAAQPAKP
jgi:cytochrome c553